MKKNIIGREVKTLIKEKIETAQCIINNKFNPDKFGSSNYNYRFLLEHPHYLQFVNKSKLSKDIIMDCICINSECYKYIPKDLIDKDIAEKAISKNPFNIMRTPDKLINMDTIYLAIESLIRTIKNFLNNNDIKYRYKKEDLEHNVSKFSNFINEYMHIYTKESENKANLYLLSEIRFFINQDISPNGENDFVKTLIWNVFMYIDKPSDDIILLMIITTPDKYFTLKDRTNKDFSLLAVSLYPDNIKYITDNSEAIHIAVAKDPYVISRIPNPSYEMCKLAIDFCPYTIFCVPGQPEELCISALKKDNTIMQYIAQQAQTYEICKLALSYNIENFRYCNPEIIAEHKDLSEMVLGSEYYKNIMRKEKDDYDE